MKVVLVVGATGQQGYAVIHALAESNEYLCLALTRNPNSPKAQQLTSFRNVKLVSADLNDIQQLRSIFKNARSSTTGEIWGVFVALAFPGLGVSADGEQKQGKVGVSGPVVHLLICYTPLMDNNPPPPGLDRHCKMVLEKHISNLNFPWTGLRIIRPGAFMENLNPGIIGRMTMQHFSIAFRSNLATRLQAVDDIGRLARVVFDNPTKFEHKTIDIAGDSLTPKELNQAFIRATGHEMPSIPWILISTMRRISPAVHDIIEEFIQADRMRRMDPRGFDANLQEAASYLKLTSFEEWARNWNDPPDKGAKQHGITLWGLFMGNTTYT
ncbi:NmrA-like family domain-containing protein 1 [Rhizoctonia solani]|uniref:NmrA-like family domain-containing protein 1 n=1 Tax=Rhizoctonia solani TaxID=456999 RepID=A0A8H8SU33_9AGAM|nr:NmrA-like family domain-containing protein 1 [Rhizoctonia solani]QRW16947.1 NmrA-like family domain-containing protein 1 [Rhizoctonia solani]